MFQLHEYPINAYLEVLRADYKRQGSNVEFWPFDYNAEALNLAASSSSSGIVLTADQDADFAILQTCQAVFTTAGTFTPSPNLTLTITYDVSGRGLQDKATHLLNIAGRGARPYWWPRPFLIRAKGSWTTIVNNLDSANAFNVRLMYGGVKIFQLPARG